MSIICSPFPFRLLLLILVKQVVQVLLRQGGTTTHRCRVAEPRRDGALENGRVVEAPPGGVSSVSNRQSFV